MDRLDSLVAKAEKNIELIIRGGSASNQTDNGLLLNTMRDLFDHLTSPDLKQKFTDAEDKTARVNIAVRLHNKVRNLAPVAHAELRAIAKACAAWMLMLFNQPVPKSLCAVIKLLSRAGQETQPFSEAIALKCCAAATDLWTRISIQTLSQMMPPLELQDIKIAVFQAYLDWANILVRMNAVENGSEIRGAICGAFDIVQSLPDGLKVHFAEQTVALGAKLLSMKVMEEAVYFLQIALSSIGLLGNSVGTISVRGAGDSDLSLVDRDELHKLKIKAQLSLAFAFKEMNHCDKAMASILAVESTLLAKIGQRDGDQSDPSYQNMTQTVAYAKFQILVQDKDWDAAEQSLNILLVHAPYDLAMDVITTYLEKNQKDVHSKGIKFYRLVANKFPREPEFTNTRIRLVEYILSTAQLHDGPASSASSSHKRVVELCGEIVGDHLTRKRRLERSSTHALGTTGSYERLKRILLERIRWNRASGKWDMVILWVDLFLKLLCEGTDHSVDENLGNMQTEEQENRVMAQLQKVDALLHTQQSSQALGLALATVEELCVTRTIVMSFLAALHANGATDAISTLLRLQKGEKPATDLSGGNLSRIMICAELTKDATTISLPEKESAIIHLLRCWLGHYSSQEAWRSDLIGDPADDYELGGSGTETAYSSASDGSVNYLAVACEMASRYLKQNLSKSGRRALVATPIPSIRHVPKLTEISTKKSKSSTEIIQNQTDKLLSSSHEESKKRSLNTTIDFNGEGDGESNKIDEGARGEEVVKDRKRSKETHESTAVLGDLLAAITHTQSVESTEEDNSLVALVATDIVTTENTSNDLLATPPSLDVDSSSQIDETVLSTSLPAVDNTGDILADPSPVKEVNAVAQAVSDAVNHTVQTIIDTPDLVKEQLAPEENADIKEPASGDKSILLYVVKEKHLLESEPSKKTGEEITTLTIIIETAHNLIEPISEIDANTNTLGCNDSRMIEQLAPEQNGTLELAHSDFTNGKTFTSLCERPVDANTTQNSFEEKASIYEFLFNTSLSDVKKLILGMLRDVIAVHRLLLTDGIDSLVLGSFADLEWLGDLAWNIGCIMVSEQNFELSNVFKEIPVTVNPGIPGNTESSSVPNERVTNQGDKGHTSDFLRESRDIRYAGAEFLEASADLYSLVPFSDQLIKSKNQGMCLVLACSARLDAATFEDMVVSCEQLKNKEKGSSEDVNGKTKSRQSANASFVTFKHPHEDPVPSMLLGPKWMEQNLLIAQQSAAAANSFLGSQAGFDSNDDDTRSFLKKVALVLEFSTLCKLQSEEIQRFVESKESEFLALSAPQLKTCADIACNERGGTVDIARKFLNYSLQICQRDSVPDYELMGALFRKLIELSPSRRDALDRVRHFEQLATGQAYSEVISDGATDDEAANRKTNCPFDPVDVDYVSSISFNYGLSLMDMGQVDLAEIFLSKALSLLPYASSVLQAWKERMQDTYVAVLKAKEEYHKKEVNFSLNANGAGFTDITTVSK